jgi:septal ring factor EnvC (AmiA/AmiB activator)
MKTILETVQAPTVDAEDIAPNNNEALELAEQELEALKTALAAEEAETEKLHKQLRDAERAVIYLTQEHTEDDPELDKIIEEIQTRVANRPTRPARKQ